VQESRGTGTVLFKKAPYLSLCFHRSFLSQKYDLTKHPMYKHLSDYDKKNTFEVEKYIKHTRKPPSPVKPDEVFEYYDCTD